MINTKQVSGRRELHYDTLDALLADAEQLAHGEVRMLGNWSLGQVFRHLTTVYENSIDGSPFLLPGLVRFLIRITMKRRLLVQPLSSGLKLPKKAASFIPRETTTRDGLTALRQVIDRLKKETQRDLHPVMGTLTIEEWTQFHLRHAELHMSFAVPA